MEVQFISLGSGSSGNSYYIGTTEYGLLIDAGISARTIRKSLKEVGIEMEKIMAVLITHDHADHIKAIGALYERFNLPIYTTKQVYMGINKNKCMTSPLNPSAVRYIEKEEPFFVRDFVITAFEVPHDGTDNVGYCIEVEDKIFTFATDLGEITATAAHYLKKADYMVIEANYEEEMLRMGRYPLFLKQRVAGKFGHLSNQDTANFLAEEYQNNWKYIWLCHLSKDNNHPDLAYKTVESKLLEHDIVIGKDISLLPLKRNSASELYILK